MSDFLTGAMNQISGFMNGFLLIVLLLGTGIYYTFRLRFIQIRKFGQGMKLVFGGLKLKGGSHENGEMSPFQSIATAIAAQVGTGNIAGAATALIGGGPGAIFWMWLSAFFGMATIYSEAVLAQTYKTEKDGEVTGGPVYYIKAAFRGKFGKVLATLFALFIIIALGFTGNMVQSNSIASAFTEVFGEFNINVPPIVVGCIVAAIAAFIFIGGTKRLAAVVEKVVPIMAGIYIIGTLTLILMHANQIPASFALIFKSAFTPKAAGGAAAGIAVRKAIQYGVARGLFSNEAGMGSTPHAHARAKAKSPHHQGLCAMIGVFIDTFIILNLTVFSILTTGALSSGKDGTALTQYAFSHSFGSFGILFVAVCLFFFAFSTILGWHFFGLTNAKYLGGKNAAIPYSIVVVICIVIGSTLKLDLVWAMADFFNSLMVVPNILALIVLSGVVSKAMKAGQKMK